jgi:hypothetical protein
MAKPPASVVTTADISDACTMARFYSNGAPRCSTAGASAEAHVSVAIQDDFKMQLPVSAG